LPTCIPSGTQAGTCNKQECLHIAMVFANIKTLQMSRPQHM